MTLCYQSLGIVYGDVSISPLYVFKSSFAGIVQLAEDDAEILGVLSLIFWTFTLVLVVKYAFIVLQADDNGEGTLNDMLLVVCMCVGFRCYVCYLCLCLSMYVPSFIVLQADDYCEGTLNDMLLVVCMCMRI